MQTIGAVCILMLLLTGFANASGNVAKAVALPKAISATSPPLFTPDGDVLFIDSQPAGEPETVTVARTGSSSPFSDRIIPKTRSMVALIMRDGEAYVWRVEPARVAFQSAYVSGGAAWILVDDPGVDHGPYPPPQRTYRFAQFNRGTVRKGKMSSASQWTPQTVLERSTGGVWGRYGVYWSYNTSELQDSVGLSLADLSGKLQYPFVSTGALKGTPEESMALDVQGDVWLPVKASDPGLVPAVPPAIARIIISTSTPTVMRYPLPDGTQASDICADHDGGFWFILRIGTGSGTGDYAPYASVKTDLAHIDEAGRIRTFAWHGAPLPGAKLVGDAKHGVWAYDGQTLMHVRLSGTWSKLEAPWQLKYPPAEGASLRVSPCGVLWFSGAPPGSANTQWFTLRLPGAQTCVDASAVRRVSVSRLMLEGF